MPATEVTVMEVLLQRDPTIEIIERWKREESIGEREKGMSP